MCLTFDTRALRSTFMATSSGSSTVCVAAMLGKRGVERLSRKRSRGQKAESEVGFRVCGRESKVGSRIGRWREESNK